MLFTKNHGLFKSIHFCAVVVGDGSSLAFRFLKVLNCTAYGSDGHRLHQAVIGNILEDGLYKVTKCLQSKIELEPHNEDITWPDMSQIMQKDYSESTVVNLEETADDGLSASSNLARIYRAMSSDRVLNYEYVNDITHYHTMSAQIIDKESPVLFADSRGHKAWIMPGKI